VGSKRTSSVFRVQWQWGASRLVDGADFSVVAPAPGTRYAPPEMDCRDWGAWGWQLRGGGGVANAPVHLVRTKHVLSMRVRSSRRARSAGRAPLKGLWPAAERAAHALRLGLHRASGACRWRSVRAYSVLEPTQGRRAPPPVAS
jgi:hypothetical protein